MYALPALLQTQKPVLLFCTQKLPAVTESVTTLDTDENHGVHGFQDMASVLRRSGRPYHFLAGYWKDLKTQSELLGWFQAAHIRQVLNHSNIGLIGHPMENMGDFGVDETAFQAQIGLHVHHLSMQQLAQTAREAPEEAIRSQMQVDKATYQMLPMVTTAEHEAASRLEWALRKTVKEKNLSGFACHFMSVSDESWMDSLPFLASSKLLAEGYSFGGEGDVTSAAAVTILQLLAGEANFTEMFTIDFGGGTVLMSHMGEGNWKMARPDSPIQMRSDPFDMVPLREKPVSLVFTLRPGAATLLNITTGPGGKLQWIICEGEVVDSPPLPNLTLVHNKFRPHMPVEEFLTRYSMLGGSHHQALTYGRHAASLCKLAALLGISVTVI
jgi:L-arabinose isomerase